MNSGLSTNIGILVLKLMARLPFRFIYLMADFFYFFVYYVAGYRKKVVLNNLKNAFPVKTDIEIKKIAKNFYRHFSDLMFETIKLSNMSADDFKKRMIIENPELVNQFYDKGKSVVVLTMHYNNWEWSSCFPLHVKHTIIGVYKQLHNLKFDDFVNQNRSCMGAELVQNKNILRRIIKAENQNEPVFVWLAGDQTPHLEQNFWFIFLNQEALFYPGPAVISKKFDLPVFFQKIEKTGRGKYKTTFELLFENPNLFSEAEIIKTYIEQMEKVIREKPEYYLWSHRRWKHKRPVGIELAI
jgi:Kdo2-lipid IVA lauroyltransferase/acyltransferase